MSDALTGSCLCGACTFTATPDEQEAGACHCGMCRKVAGGINIAVGCSDVTWNEGAPIKVYRSSDWAERGFCGTCGANLFWRAVGGDAGREVIALNAFDTPGAFPVTRQIFVDDKPDSYALAGDLVSLTGAEVRAMYAPEGGTT
ncbi:GFA family protein [Jannaschia marina]|uniref:GFA family protein n=1 Tax=Jannaschia marina TaxID=2741674 RepID=UPI001ABB1E3F|nr:GFA family protein [Jannaschia marina]